MRSKHFLLVVVFFMSSPSRAGDPHLVLGADIGFALEVQDATYGGLDSGIDVALKTDIVTVGMVASGFVRGGATKPALGLELGHTFDLDDGFMVDVLADLGTREHHASGGLLDDDPGVSRSFTYVGGRLRLGWAVNDPRARVVTRMGLAVMARGDLGGPTTVEYDYEDCFLACGTTRASHVLGGAFELGALFQLTVDFRL